MTITIQKSDSGAFFTIKRSDDNILRPLVINDYKFEIDEDGRFSLIDKYSDKNIISNVLYSDIINGETDQAFSSFDDLYSYVTTNFFRKAGGGSGTIPQDLTPDTIMVNNPQGQPGGDIWFFGTSITLGTGASVQGNRYSSLVAAALGATEHNFGIGGQVASALDLSTIPTKGSTDKYIVIEFGTNELVHGPVTTSAFNTAMMNIINNVLGKGWAANQIILMSTFASTQNFGGPNAGDSALRAFSAVTLALSISFGTHYVECYDSILNLYPLALTTDNIHPNDAGHGLIELLVLAQLPPVFIIGSQKELVNGDLELKDLAIKALRNVIPKYLLGIDTAGNVGMINSLPDNLVLNKTLLAGNLLQKSATLPTPFGTGQNVNRDVAMSLFATFYWAANASTWASIGADNTCSIKIFTGYSGGTIKILGSNNQGITVSGADGSVNIDSGLTMGSPLYGFLGPRMTTTQKNNLVAVEGMEVYDKTLHKKCVYTGSAWETITSI